MSQTEELLIEEARRLEVLVGEVGAGNNSKKVKNEINKLVNILLESKVINKAKAKTIIKQL